MNGKMMIFFIFSIFFGGNSYLMSPKLYGSNLANAQVIDADNIKNEEQPMLIKTFPGFESVPVKRKYLEKQQAYVFDPDYYELIDRDAANAYYNHHFVGKEISSIIELFNQEKQDPRITQYFDNFHIGYNQAKNPVISYALGFYITYEEENMDLYAAFTWYLVFILDDDKKIVQSVKVSTGIIGP